jgi:hypothetical protein
MMSGDAQGAGGGAGGGECVYSSFCGYCVHVVLQGLLFSSGAVVYCFRLELLYGRIVFVWSCCMVAQSLWLLLYVEVSVKWVQ